MCVGYRFELEIRGLKSLEILVVFAEPLNDALPATLSYVRRGTVCKKDTEFHIEMESHLVVGGDCSSTSVTSLGDILGELPVLLQ